MYASVGIAVSIFKEESYIVCIFNKCCPCDPREIYCTTESTETSVVETSAGGGNVTFTVKISEGLTLVE